MQDELEEVEWEFRLQFDVYTDDEARRSLEALCEATVRINMIWINGWVWDNKEYPPCCLEDAGVQYMLPEACHGVDGPCQTIRGAAEMLDSGWGTCIDIACYMSAQLRLRGKPAYVYLENMKTPSGRPIAGEYHVILRSRRGRIDYTQDLIDGRTSSCDSECGGKTFRAVAPSVFDPTKLFPR